MSTTSFRTYTGCVYHVYINLFLLLFYYLLYIMLIGLSWQGLYWLFWTVLVKLMCLDRNPCVILMMTVMAFTTFSSASNLGHQLLCF